VATLLVVLDGLIAAAALGASVCAVVMVVGLLTGGRSTPQQARDRQRRYRELLKRGRQSLWESPEDQELGSTIRNINLRQSQRRRVFLAARIRHPALPGELAGTILDLSDTGARLAFGHTVELPREVELEIGKGGQRVRAEVVWSKDNTCGVRFIVEASTNTADQVVVPLRTNRVA
jgi:hypothetical protein